MKFIERIYNAEQNETYAFNFEINHRNKVANFSLTVDVYLGHGRTDSSLIACGQVTEAHKYLSWVEQRAARWHLWGLNGSIHYVANALYWLGWQGWHENKSYGKNPPNIDVFKDHINWGIIPADLAINPNRWLTSNDPFVQNHAEAFQKTFKPNHADWLKDYVAEKTNEITAYLNERLDRVRQEFIKDMLFVFGEKGGFEPADILKELES